MTDAVTATLFLPGENGEAVVHAVRGHEEVSRPFQYEVDFTSHEVVMDEALGSVAALVITDQHDQERHVEGIVDSIVVLGSHEDLARYRIVLVPAPFILSYRFGSRIFQKTTVPNIVRRVFTDAKVADEFVTWDLAKESVYPEREYIVQYNESEWDFVSRLLEEEGIWYCFEHSASGHKMILRDDSTIAKPGTPKSLAFEIDPAGHDDVRTWHWARQTRVAVKKVTLSDYDGLRPSLPMKKEKEDAKDPVSTELYEYPGRYVEPSEGERLAQARLDALRCRRHTASATTNAIVLAPGRTVTLEGHPTADGEYFVVDIELDVTIDQQDQAGPITELGRPDCLVHYRTIPKKTKFRPARLSPRPKIVGIQTARLTGPSSEEIHCDKHARVTTQFHWDLEGQLDDKSSCWIRTSQAQTTGSVMIPRMKWENLVEYADGDPDRPIVMGRLYNSLFKPEYVLPAQKTVSGHRSNSSPGAGGSNELMIDDAAGAERMVFNCAKDTTVKAANNKKAKTTKNHGRTVGSNRTQEVGENETIAVTGFHEASVGVDHGITIGGNRTVKGSKGIADEITGDITVHVGGLENMMVGNPIAAVLEIVTAEAISAATGAAAMGASRAEAGLLGPLAPALASARGAVGSAAQFAGPASALLGGGNPTTAVFGAAAGSLSSAAGAASGGDIAAGMAQAVVSGAAAQAAAAAGGGGGDGDSSQGNGTWGTTCDGDVKEDIGALAALTSGYGISFGIGGTLTETVGAARIELIRGGKTETTGGGKIETVGVYMVDVKNGIDIDAKGAVMLNMSSQEQTIKGGHTINGGLAGIVSAKTLMLEGKGKVSLTCGEAEVVVDSGGVQIKGATTVTIEASKEIKLKPVAIGPG